MLDVLLSSPIIAAAKDEYGLQKAISSQSDVVFVLYGDICAIPLIVDRIKGSGKIAIVHIDLIEGLSGRDVSVKFIKQQTKADGIISTKVPLIRMARALGLITVQRIFLLDSRAFDSATRSVTKDSADFVEILPGCMPKIIKKMTSLVNVPLIAGGMIFDKEDIIHALGHGAIAISTTNIELWEK